MRSQKNDGSIQKNFKIVISNFQIKNKVDRFRYFQKIFLVTKTKFEVILRMFFLKPSNVHMLFSEKILM